MGGGIAGRLRAHERRAILDAPAYVGGREGVRLDAVIAVGCRADERHQSRRMLQDAGAKLARDGGESVLLIRVDEGVLATLAVDQADVEVAARARRRRRRLR